MPYVKATAVGVVAALIAPIVWVFSWIAVDLAAEWIRRAPQGSGGGAVSTVNVGVVLPMLLGFALGFVWTLRRGSSTR